MDRHCEMRDSGTRNLTKVKIPRCKTGTQGTQHLVLHHNKGIKLASAKISRTQLTGGTVCFLP